jgi:hypothetical protein
VQAEDFLQVLAPFVLRDHPPSIAVSRVDLATAARSMV